MLHRIPSKPGLAPMAQAIESCTHCGLCLPACPTFVETRREAESPRGRISLMRQALEQTAPLREIQPHLDACVRCRACESACPAQVPYHDLLIRFQEHTHSSGRPSPVLRALLRASLPHPGGLRFLAAASGLLRPFREYLGEPARAALDLLPRPLPPRRDLPSAYAGRGDRAGMVALLPGCVASVLAPEITQAAVEVLTRNGYDVLLPERPSCCGSALLSLDDPEGARRTASAYLESLPPGLDAVVSTSPSCCAALRDYPLFFTGTPLEDKAHWVATHAWDICAFLDSVKHRPFPPLPVSVRAAYHQPCHLRGASPWKAEAEVSSPHFSFSAFSFQLFRKDSSRKLLSEVSGLELAVMDDPEICCGAAGVYPVFQSEMAKRLGWRRLRAWHKSGARILISGDPACIAHLRHHAQVAGEPLTALHTVEVLAKAYQQQSLVISH